MPLHRGSARDPYLRSLRGSSLLQSPPPLKAAGGLAALSPGGTAAVPIGLPSGNYLAICLVRGPDGEPHAHPETVQVSRPSDALAARLAVADATTSLFLGLGAVALLVGGIGIANVMVISVLERRTEVGLRRALGAARRHVAAQFLAESLLLGGFGGASGIAIGVLATYALALQRGWRPLVPATAAWAALGAALLIGTTAGLYPALRAARLAPTDALRTT